MYKSYSGKVKARHENAFNDGKNKEKYEIATNLLKNTKTSLKDISLCTGLPLKVINKLKESL